MLNRYRNFLTESSYFKQLAHEYGRLHLSLDDSREYSFVENREVVFKDDLVIIQWRWNGKYGYIEGGEFEVPIDVLCDKTRWNDYIKSEVAAKRLHEQQIKQVEQTRRRTQEIEAAKKLLREEGVPLN
jgi:hypothetical protein